jgi:hypothetical protein
MTTLKNQDLKVMAGIILITISVCGFTSGSHIYVTDGAAMYFMSSSMIDRYWFDVDIHPNTGGGKYGPDGRYYMPFGFLQPLLAVPFLLAGRILQNIYQVSYLPFFTITWFNWLMCGLLSSLVYYVFRLFNISRKVALLIGFAITLSTPFWVYSQTFFSEPLTALLGLASWVLMYKSNVNDTYLPLCLSGFLSGMTTWARPLGGLVIPPLLVYLLLLEKNKTRQRSVSFTSFKRFVAFVVTACSTVLVYFLYNWVRFQSVFETGYDKLPSGLPRSFTLDSVTGIRILLFSPGKSIFVFTPLLILIPFAVVLSIKCKRFIPELVFSLLSGFLYISVLARWARVEGGIAWGPRLFLPALPLLFVSFIALFQKHSKTVYLAVIILALAGMLIQIPGVFVNFSTYIARHPHDYYNFQDGQYMLSFNPFPGHLKELTQYIRDLPHLTPFAHHETFTLLEQINPDGVADIWWLHMWLDRVPISLIARLLGCLTLLTLAGTALIVSGLRNDHQA